MSKKRKIIGQAFRTIGKYHRRKKKTNKKLSTESLIKLKESFEIKEVRVTAVEDNNEVWINLLDKEFKDMADENEIIKKFEIELDFIFKNNSITLKGCGIPRDNMENFCLFMTYENSIPEQVCSFANLFCENLFFRILPNKKIPIRKWNSLI
jgi:hypothetical protein